MLSGVIANDGLDLVVKLLEEILYDLLDRTNNLILML